MDWIIFVVLGVIFFSAAGVLDKFLFYSENRRTLLCSYLDSFIINFSYGFALFFVSSFAIYWASVMQNIDIERSLLILIAYFIVEIRLLFNDEAIKDPDHFTSWRSWPTIGIIASTPLVFLYTLFRQRNLNLFSIKGVLNIWATIRYNVVNPRWLRPIDDNNKTFIGGSRDRIPTPCKKHISWLYKRIYGTLSANCTAKR